MKGRAVRNTGLRTVALVAAAAAMLSGCAAQYRDHGYVPPEADLERIVPGIDTRDTVEDVVGVPTARGVGVVEQEDYYWVSSRMRSFAWQRPEVVEREVVAISFDQRGTVRGVERYGLEDGRVVPLSRRVTDSSAGNIGFIRRLFGNIGGISATELLRNE